MDATQPCGISATVTTKYDRLKIVAFNYVGHLLWPGVPVIFLIGIFSVFGISVQFGSEIFRVCRLLVKLKWS